jgi:hypothetical protein
MIPVEGHKGLYRDENTNAIINCNDFEYEEYIKFKNSKLNEKNELNEIKSDIEQIKLAINLLIQKINN